MVIFMFATVAVIDQGLNPVEAMKESVRIARGHFWSLFGLGVLLVLILAVGVLAFGVGLFVAIPIVSLAYVHAYRVLLYKAGPRPPEQDATT